MWKNPVTVVKKYPLIIFIQWGKSSLNECGHMWFFWCMPFDGDLPHSFKDFLWECRAKVKKAPLLTIHSNFLHLTSHLIQSSSLQRNVNNSGNCRSMRNDQSQQIELPSVGRTLLLQGKKEDSTFCRSRRRPSFPDMDLLKMSKSLWFNAIQWN